MKVLVLSHMMNQTQNVLPHSHSSFEFHYIASGTGFFMIENQEFPLREGQLFFTLPGESHHIFRKDKSKYLFQYVFHLDELPKDAVEALGSLIPAGRFFHDPGRRGDWERWRRLHESGIPLADRALSMQFLGYILELSLDMGRTEKTEKEPLLLEKALNYIQNRLEEKLSLDKISTALDADKFQLIRLFRQELGITPQKYWTRLKVEGARELIKENRLSLSEIAARFAFSDEFHLSRSVKKWTGYSPREWRRIKP